MNAVLPNLSIVMVCAPAHSGEDHREHARSLGVNKDLIKPKPTCREDHLLAELRSLLAAQEAVGA